MSTRIRLLPHQSYDSLLSLYRLIIHSSIAARTTVTVTFSKYYAEDGPNILREHNRRNCQLTFGVKYAILLWRLLVTHTLSFSQSSSRFLIWSCHCRLRKFFLHELTTQASNSRSEAFTSWMTRSLLPSSQPTTV